MQKATLSELEEIDYNYLLALEDAGHVTRMLAVQDFLIEWDEMVSVQQLKEAQAKKQGAMTYQVAIAGMFEDYEAGKAELETD